MEAYDELAHNMETSYNTMCECEKYRLSSSRFHVDSLPRREIYFTRL
jgi:hypothetical protein